MNRFELDMGTELLHLKNVWNWIHSWTDVNVYTGLIWKSNASSDDEVNFPILTKRREL